MRRTLTLVLLLFTVWCVNASDVKFYSVNTIYGLSVRDINSICKDRDGFVWASGKNGVLRLTESDYRIYQLPFTSPDVFSIRLVYSGDRLFAFTNNGQIFRYDEVYDRFGVVTDVRRLLNNSHLVLTQLVAGCEDELWLATSMGIYMYDKGAVFLTGKESVEIQSICRFDEDNLFVITQDGISLLNIKTKECGTEYAYPKGFSSIASKMFYDVQTGKLWVGTVSDGLYFYDVKKRTFSKILAGYFLEQPVLAIEPNSDTTVLIGIDGKGVWEATRDGRTILNTYKEDIDNPSSLSGDGVYDILCDDDNRVWVATYSGGLSFFDQKTPLVTHVAHQINNPNSLVNNNVNKILEDSRGNIWFGTNNGISRWEPGTDTWSSYYHNKHKQAQAFLALCEDKDGNIWAGTYSSGVYVLDGRTGKELTHYSHGESRSELSGRFIFDIFEDGEGDIWIGGIRSEIICYLSKEKRFRFYDFQPLRTFAEYSPGKILMVCSYGLVMLDKQSGDTEILLNGYLGQDVLVTDGYIWLATGGDGLVRYGYADRSVMKFRTEQGLISNHINSIIHAEGYLWLGTENGLCRFNPDDYTVTTYPSVYNLSKYPFNVNADIRLKNGSLMFGTGDGAMMFDPNKIYPGQSAGRIFLQDISISGRSIRENPKIIGDIPINRQSELRLKHYQNTLAVEVLPVGIPSTGVKFSWQLSGLDSGWSQPSGVQTIAYANIPPGNYCLGIRMLDNTLSQVIDERVIEVRIIPPVWGTVWFRILMAVSLAGLFYFLLRTYINRMHRRYAEDKIRFFANMAHEMRTSLTLIDAPVQELAKDLNMADKSRYYVNLVAEQTGRLSSVATQLLDFQKADVGKGQVFPVMADIVDLVRQRTMMFGSVAAKKGVSLDFSSGQESFMTAVDVLKIEKVVDNLISNAIKYSHQDGTVEIMLCCDRKRWVLEVKDYGLGISDKARKKLFREFYRGDNAVNSRMVGSGIGLLLVKSYVTMHKGQVSVSSKVNAGSSFKVSIPYMYVVPENIPASGSEHKEDTRFKAGSDTGRSIADEKPVAGNKKGHVLIVEDNLELRQFLSRALREQYNVSTAGNGTEAWEIIQKQMPDLVISDVMMPGMDGFELCGRIKSTFESSHIPVILLTTLSEKAKELEGLGLGADDYVTKPFDMTLLMQRIASIMKNREIVRERAFRLIRQPDEEQPVLANSLNDRFVRRAVEVVNGHIADSRFGKEGFASEMNVSASLLYKKIKSLTGLSPVDFIKNIRLDHSLELLRSGRYSVTEVSELCGFSSAGYFSTVFKKHFGRLPTDVQG